MSNPILHPKIGNSRDQELLSRADYGVYTKTPQGELAAYCYRPTREVSSVNPSAAVVFFHGGKFDQRLVAQYAPHALHFANRGITAFIVEYRVNGIEGTGPMEAMEDARTFLKYLDYHQEHFSIDPQRIIVGGGACGGFLALHLCSRHKKNINFMGDLPVPIAGILYSPLTDITSKKGILGELFPDDKVAKDVSPSEQHDKNAVPLIIFHGKADQTIPFSMSERFVKAYKRKKNRIEFMEFETARHIDFNLNVNPQYYELTIRAADGFLVELGVLEHDPDVFID